MANLDRLPPLSPIAGTAGAGGTPPTRSRTNTADEAPRNFGNTPALALMLPSATSQAQTHVTILGKGRYVSVLRRTRLGGPPSGPTAYDVNSYGSWQSGQASLALSLSELFQAAYLRMCHKVRVLQPCQILGLSHNVSDSGTS